MEKNSFFKINLKKEDIILLIIIELIISIIDITLVVLSIIYKEWLIYLLFLPIIIMIRLIIIYFYQWFEIYDDKIIVKSVFGKVTTVNFNNVKQIYKSNIISKTSNKKTIECLIFDDNRKINLFFEIPNNINRKKLCVKVPINDQLIQLIKLKNIEIIDKELF